MEDLPLSLRKKLVEMQRRMLAESSRKAEDREKPKSPMEIVKSLLEDEKAREVLEHAMAQYPEATEYAVGVIAELARRGRITSLDGYLLYRLLLALGIPVRLPSKIKFVRKGREVDVREYLEE